MKKGKKLIIALFLALTFIVTDLAAAPATAQAAGTLKFANSGILAKGDHIGYGIINSVKSDKILSLKSSNTKVLTVKKKIRTLLMQSRIRIQIQKKIRKNLPKTAVVMKNRIRKKQR